MRNGAFAIKAFNSILINKIKLNIYIHVPEFPKFLIMEITNRNNQSLELN